MNIKTNKINHGIKFLDQANTSPFSTMPWNIVFKYKIIIKIPKKMARHSNHPELLVFLKFFDIITGLSNYNPDNQ